MAGGTVLRDMQQEVACAWIYREIRHSDSEDPRPHAPLSPCVTRSYFARLAEERMGPGDQAILITHAPRWLIDWFWWARLCCLLPACSLPAGSLSPCSLSGADLAKEGRPSCR